MNLIKSIKAEIRKRTFDNKVENILNTIYSQKNSDVLIHNKGEKLVRDGKNLFKLEHEFTDGLYLRRMLLKKGSIIISGIHKRDHVWFLMTGHISISTKEKENEDFIGPYIGFSNKGTRRLIYAHEDSIFQNVFKNPNNLKNLDKLEEYNYAMTKKDYNDFIRNK